MIAVPNVKRRWDARQYRRITAARYEAGKLGVEFEDGARVSLAVADLQPSRARTPDWTRVRFTPYEVVVPTADGDFEIAWSTIRMLTDPEYDAHLAAASVAQRQWIGRRIQELRQQRGLDRADLAERAGVSPEHLARIEAGDATIEFPPVQRLVDGMGCTLNDLAVTPGARFEG